MKYPILFKNVSENYAEYYKDEERNSNIIGFVNPDSTNDFGYIISGGRQYGLSYQTLKEYIDDAYNKSVKYADNFIYNPLNSTINTLKTVVLQNRNNINNLSNTVTAYLDEAKAYTTTYCTTYTLTEAISKATDNATILANNAKTSATNTSKEYTDTTVNTAKTELNALIINEIQELSYTVNSYHSYITDKMVSEHSYITDKMTSYYSYTINKLTSLTDRMMNYSTEEIRNCSNTGHNATLKAIKINQTYLQTYLVGSVSIKVRSSTSGAVPEVPAQMVIKKVNTDNTENIIAYSLNFIKQSDYKNKYITWYFDTFLLESGLDYIFTLVDKSGNNIYISPHTTTVNASTNHITCIGPSDGTINNYLPAFGVNLSNIYTNDIGELKQSISNLNALIENLYAQTGAVKPTNT